MKLMSRLYSSHAGFPRREFLWTSVRLLGAAAVGAAAPLAWLERAGAQDVIVPGKEKMIVRSLRYMDLEMPVHLLDSWVTPAELFYVRNHLPLPSVNMAEWRLAVTDEVEHPLELTFAELEKFEPAR